MLTPFSCGVISAEKGNGSNINRVSERTTGGGRIKDFRFSFFSRQLMAKTANITQKKRYLHRKIGLLYLFINYFQSETFSHRKRCYCYHLVEQTEMLSRRWYLQCQTPDIREDLCLNKVFAHWFTFRWYQQWFGARRAICWWRRFTFFNPRPHRGGTRQV